MVKAIKLDAMRNALSSLENALAIIENSQWFEQQSAAMQNTLMAGTIQNFEFVYEISIRLIKRQLETEALSPEEIDHGNFRNILRLAAEKGIIADIKAWFGYREMRNITAHTYDEDKAKAVQAALQPFVLDARDLLQNLESRNV